MGLSSYLNLTTSGQPPLEIFYAGTFSNPGEQGLFVVQFNRATESMEIVQRLEGKASPSFLALHPNKQFLYAVQREGLEAGGKHGSVAAYAIDPTTGHLTWLNEVSSEGQDPCHTSISPGGKFAFVANYSTGNVAMVPISPDGRLGKAVDVAQHTGSGPDKGRQQGPHAHQAVVADRGRMLYVSDLGTDRVWLYFIDEAAGKLIAQPNGHGKNTPGSGPRHLAMHPSGRFAYSCEELTSTIGFFKRDLASGALVLQGQVPMLPAGFQGQNSGADIHCSPDGKFLYASNRGHDSLVIYRVDPKNGKLTLVNHALTLGGHPRNFCVDRQGTYIWVANRDANQVVLFRRDTRQGTLQPTDQRLDIPQVVCFIQY
jgi:6-phosphogluconolactonase